MTAPAGHQHWFHRHPTLTSWALALFACIIALILAEFAARLFFPSWMPAREERAKFWTYDEQLGWAHAPNQRGRLTHRDFSVEVRINSQGLRDREYPMARTAKKRILVLGDSYGWGFGVELHQRFDELLEEAHPDWEVVNASVSGYGTDQELLYLQHRGAAFKPDVVLLLFFQNDFLNNIRAEQYWHFKPRFVLAPGELKLVNVPVPKPTIKQRVKWFILGRTCLGSRIYYVNALLNASAETKERDQRDSSRTHSEEQDGMHELMHQIVKRMKEVAKENAANFVIVSTPMDEEKRRFLQRVSGEEKIPYLPLDAAFSSSGTSIMFPHDPHWNAKGHAVAADAIEAFLWASGALDTSRSER